MSVTRPDQTAEVETTSGNDTLCEVTVVLGLVRWLKKPRIKFPCKRTAAWVSLNMCCGATTRACEPHYKIAHNAKHEGDIFCGACGKKTDLIWSRLS